MNIIPTEGRVAIKQSRFEEETTKSGIVLTNKQKQNSRQGQIIAIGKNVNSVSVDNRVVYPTNVGVELNNIDGENYVVLKEDDILAIIK